jgi:hypothetical protein
MTISTVCDSKISIQLDKYVHTRQQYLDAIAVLENDREFVLEDLMLVESRIKLLYNSVSELSKTIDKYNKLIGEAQVSSAPVDLFTTQQSPIPANVEPTVDNIPVSTIVESNVLLPIVTQGSHNDLVPSILKSMDEEYGDGDGDGKPMLKPQYANMAIADAAEAFMSCFPLHNYDAGDLLKALYDGLSEANSRKQRNSLQTQLLRAIKMGSSHIKQSKTNGCTLYYYA